MVDMLEEIALYAGRKQYDLLAEAVAPMRDVDHEVPKYKRPDGSYRSAPARAKRFVHSRIPEDPLHFRTVIKNTYKRLYPYKGVNFP